MDPNDLVYRGRDRKRPPGASPTVRRIYALLSTAPLGMSVADLHDAMRGDWAATDAYRAYEQHLKANRQSVVPKATSTTISEYGTPRFLDHARQWWIRSRLTNMRKAHTARREGAGKEAIWFAGERAPREMVDCPIDVHLRPMNVQDAQRHADAHLRREQVKAVLLEVLQDSLLKGRHREAVQEAFDYLSGRK